MRKLLILTAIASCVAFAADPITDALDGQVTQIEREILGLAQKMPADKYDFAPKDGTFATVRTFGQQVRHIATVMYMFAASARNEKMPVEVGPEENGAASLKTKDQSVKYLQEAIAYSRKAMQGVTQQNMNDKVVGPGGNGMTARISSALFIGPHSYDHYGQMVVYARMNNVVPGGGPPPPAAKGKGK
jgi:uncharacterized damage-inducible protein DinB